VIWGHDSGCVEHEDGYDQAGGAHEQYCKEAPAEAQARSPDPTRPKLKEPRGEHEPDQAKAAKHRVHDRLCRIRSQLARRKLRRPVASVCLRSQKFRIGAFSLR